MDEWEDTAEREWEQLSSHYEAPYDDLTRMVEDDELSDDVMDQDLELDEEKEIDDDDEYLTSDSRRFFEPEMPKRGADEPAPERPVTIDDIRQSVEKVIPWRHGKTYKNLGIFKKKAEVVRSKYRDDITAAMHELGHYLDKKLGLRDAGNDAAQQELLDAGAVTSNPSYTKKRQLGEGAAQFFLSYAVNDAQARMQFPEYYKEFENALGKNPETRDSVKAIQERVSAYYKQNPEERLHANIVHGTDAPETPLVERARKFGEQVYNMGVDALTPLQRVTEAVREKMNVRYLDDKYNLSARARTAAGFRGRADYDTSKFLDVLRKLPKGKEEHTRLSDYLAAARALNYRLKGLIPGLSASLEEAQAIVKNAPLYIKHAAMELKDIYREMMIKTLVDTGIMTRDQLDYLEVEWPDYVPFLRVGSPAEFEQDLRRFLKGRGKSLVNLATPIKQTKGVANEAEVYKIRDPLEGMLRNIQAFHALAARNEVGKTMVSIAQVEGMGRFAEEVPVKGEKGDNVFHVWIDGQKKYYATDPDVYAALTSMNEVSPTAAGLQSLARALTIPADIFRMGTTRYNPAFIVTNFFRDTTSAAINSESWMPPIINSIRGLMIHYSSDPKMKALMEEMRQEGVFYSGVTEIRGNSPRELARTIQRAYQEGGMTSDVRRRVRTLFDYVGSFNEAVELAPKLYEYYYLTQRGVPKQEAAMLAREVNIDFQRAGTIGRVYNKITPFFNANIQGVDKTAQTFARRPYQTMGKLLLFAGLPSLIAWVLGQLGSDEDRKEYEGINKQMKDLYWHVKMGDTWYRLPKPQQYGLFGSLVERGLDAAYKKDPAAFRGYGHAVFEDVMPPLLPNLVTTGIESVTNYDFFTGRPIVPQKYERLPKEMQYGPETSGIAKIVGEWTGLSPMIIDHAVRGTGGTVASGGLNLIDKAADSFGIHDRNREATRVSEYPGPRSFTTNPYRNNEFIDQFYDLADQTEKAKNEFDARRKSGQPMRASMDAREAKRFSVARQMMTKLNKARAKVRESGRTPELKRKQMDEIDKRVVNVARKTIERYYQKTGTEQ
jgi:hypothetical protein